MHMEIIIHTNFISEVKNLKILYKQNINTTRIIALAQLAHWNTCFKLVQLVGVKWRHRKIH